MRVIRLLAMLLLFPALAHGFGQTIPGDQRIEGDTWFPIGPAPITELIPGQTNSGRATVIAVNPANEREVWLGTASGGVWHSVDGGGAWRSVPVASVAPAPGSLAVGSLVVEGCDATGCRRLWVGTGENSLRRDTQHGSGLLVGAPDEFGDVRLVHVAGSDRLARGSIQKIVLGPGGADGLSEYLLIALSRGVTSNATHTTFNAPEPAAGWGIHRFDFAADGDSSPATGTWRPRFTVPGTEAPLPREALSQRVPTDLVMDPRDERRLWAAFLGTGIFHTTDGGGLWCPLNPGVVGADPRCTTPTRILDDSLPDVSVTAYDHVRLALAPSDPEVLYALFGKCANRFTDSCDQGYEIYKHLPGSGSLLGWRSLRPPIDSTHSRYTNVLTVDPQDPDVVYLGFVDSLWRLDTSDPDAVFPGAISNRNSIHDDLHALVFAERADGGGYLAYAASDGGAFRADDPVPTTFWAWEDLNANLPTLQMQTIAGHFNPSDPDASSRQLLGGTQDNGCLLFTGGRAWRGLGLQDCGYTFFDAADPTILFTTKHEYSPQRTSGGRLQLVTGRSCGRIPATSPSAETVAFYPPFVQAPDGSAIYFASRQLFRSTDRGDCWTAVSPIFASSDERAPGSGRKNVITAVVESGGRVYVGLQGGQIFGSTLPDLSSWTPLAEGDPGQPSALPVTAIVVSPRDPAVIYATLSGFGTSHHVWRFDGAGWEERSGALGDLPANVVAIEARPTAPFDVLWLGTDAGVHRSFDDGVSWERVNRGMPDVAVYDLVIDQRLGRVFAATHGRGVYALTAPFLMTYEGWVDGDIWDIPVYGSGFPNEGDLCELEILLEDGTRCTGGRRDVLEGDIRGGEIRVDGDGFLTSGHDLDWAGRDVVWACFSGSCLGRDANVPIDTCKVPGNAIAAIRVRCDSGVVATAPVGDSCPLLSNPPTTAFELDPAAGGAGGGGGGAGGGGGGVILLAVVQSGDGATRTLCEAELEVDPARTAVATLLGARDALNGSAACADATVRAIVQGMPDPWSLEEDRFERPHLVLDAPGVIGSQLMTGVAVPPGRATGTCFRVSGLGVPTLGQVLISKIELATAASGAAGGSLTVTETSNLGRCAVTVPTSARERPAEIAARVVAGLAVDSASCPRDQNPRDISRQGDLLITVVAHTLEVCTTDPGLGFAIAPEELPVPQLTPPAGPAPGGPDHSVGLFAGALFADRALGDGPEIGLRYGRQWRPRQALEGELALAFLDRPAENSVLARLQGQWRFDLSTRTVRPFLLAGLGVAHLERGADSDTVALATLGAGLRFLWRVDRALRLDGRYFWLDDPFGLGAGGQVEVTVGASFRF